MKFKCIFFDFDGVIIQNSQLLFLEIMQNVLWKKGLSLEITYFINHFLGWKGEMILEQIKNECKFKATDNDLKEVRRLYQAELIINPKIDSSIYELLETINYHYICSSNKRSFIKKVLIKTNLEKYFPDNNIFSLENTPKLKPNPLVYLNALAHSGLFKEDCCAIEDSITGAIAAKKAKLYTFGYIGSLPESVKASYSKSLNNVGVNRVINNFSEMY
jgi:beta-phosphoglucomutase-like phosphatase (HAD superfamily)